MSPVRLFCTALLSLVYFSSFAQAAIEFDVRVRGNFDVLFYSAGPLAGAIGGAGFPLDVPIAAEAIGTMRFSIEDIADGQTSANILSATSVGPMQGVVPGPFFTISPNVQFVGGMLTNIQHNGGVITSANVTDLNMVWEMDLFLGPNTARIVSSEVLPFNGTVSGLPFGLGDQLIGTAGSVDGLLDLGNGNFDPNPAIAVSNRFLTVVPEPTSSAAVLGCMVGLCLVRRARTRS
jgi:hypothetical protein